MWAVARAPCEENVIEAPSTGPVCTKAQGRWILAATILASAMAFIDGTVVNVALAAIQTGLNSTALDLQWVIEAYSLFLSAFLLMGGSLGDYYGRRRIFLVGVTVFALASAACGLAGNIGQLIAARAVQGLGAALLVPGSLAIISGSFPQEEKGRAIGTWSGFSAVTTAIGPVLGGWLVEHLSWRAVFYINLPLALLVILITFWHVPEKREPQKSAIDWLGATLVTLGLGALVYGLIESSRLTTSGLTLLLVTAGLLLGAFFWTEARASNPMLPLGLFRSAYFSGTNLLTFLLYAALGGTLFFLPLNLIQVQGYSASTAGAALLPFVLVLSLLSRWSGGLLTKYGPRMPLIIGPLIASLGFLLFTIPSVGAGYWSTFFPAVLVLGLGMAVTIAPLTTTVMSSVAENRSGVASGVNNAVARSAGLIAIAVLGIVMLHSFTFALERRLAAPTIPPSLGQSLLAQRTRLAGMEVSTQYDQPTRQLARTVVNDSFVRGFRTVMVIGSALALASALTAFSFIRSPAVNR